MVHTGTKVFRVITIAAICALLSAVNANAETVLIKSIVVIDGTGAPATAPTDVEIVEGKITKIGVNLKSKATQTIDGTGKFMTPGLIDCHVHLRSVPGSIFRKESEREIHEQQKLQLQAYLKAGVTTVLDAAAPNALYGEIERLKAEIEIPTVMGLSPFLTPKNGYFASEQSRRGFYSDLAKPIEKIGDIHDRIEEARPFKPMGLKTAIEFGFGPFTAFPVFNDEELKKIREESQKAGLPVFVHTESEKAFRLALELKPYAFMHGGFFDEPASAEIVKDIKDSGAYVVSTLAIYKMMLLMWDQSLFDDPWFKNLVPPKQIETAKKESSSVIKLLAVQNKPWFAPTFIAEWMSGLFIRQSGIEQNYQNSKVSLKAMYDHGIPIVMGSDAGNYPLFATFFHGVGSVLEIEALQDAGIPAIEAIKSATSGAAKMLKINGEVGTIAVGKTADLVILNENPLTSVKAFRAVSLVIKNGHPQR